MKDGDFLFFYFQWMTVEESKKETQVTSLLYCQLK